MQRFGVARVIEVPATLASGFGVGVEGANR